MGRQIVHRLIISMPALIGVLFLCFCLLQVVPADPAMKIMIRARRQIAKFLWQQQLHC